MTKVDMQKHKSLLNKLQELLDIALCMKESSQDDLLRQFVEECQSWLCFAKEHTDDEELRSLKCEIAARFYNRFNVRIEPKDLDNERLSITKEIIEDFEFLC